MKNHYFHDYSITKILREEDYIIIITNGVPKLKINICADNMLRIWADHTGKLIKEASYAVENEIFKAPKYVVLETEDYCLITTNKVSLRVYKHLIRLEYYTADNKTLISKENESMGMGWTDDDSVFMYEDMNESEHFYGLGEDNDAYKGNLDRRGTTRDMITGQRINKGHVTADIPVTFFMSTGVNQMGYGIFHDNTYKMWYDMGKESNEYYYISADGGELLFYFIYGPTFKTILDSYTSLTGRPSMLPKWTLGYIQSKCTFYDWPEVDDIIETMGNKNIPLDCMVFDFDWAEYMQNFKWNSRFNGKSPEKIASYQAKGINFMVSNSGPMIKKESDNYESALNAGILAKDSDGSTVTCGHYGGQLMDFSNPDMKEWLRPSLNRLIDEGIKGWWLDLTEPEGDPDGTQYFAGDKSKVHNVFSLLNSKTYYELSKEHNPTERPFILTRTGTAGIQKYGTSIWTGDVFSDYDTFSAHCPEALNTTMSGISAWTCDSSGFISSTYNGTDNIQLYNNDPAAHGLLYERWLQFSCFAPIMRAHHVGPVLPYEFGKLIENGCKHYINLRYSLLPYIYSYMYKSHKVGASIMRPLVFEYQSDENVYNLKDEYLFGSELLIAPVLKESIASRKVYMPEGKWIDYDYGYEYDGENYYEIYAPQNRIPIFVRAGAIIPMVKPMLRTGQDQLNRILFDIYPEGTSEFNMYNDDGKSFNYEKNDYTLTRITCCETKNKDALIIELKEENKLYTPSIYEFKIHLAAMPCVIEVNDIAYLNLLQMTSYDKECSGYYVDYFNKCLYIKVKAASELNYKINIKYDTLAPLTRVKFNGNGRIKEENKGQLPYLMPPASVPCKIPAINFDRGGEGIAYHKIEAGNETQVYRKDVVDISECNELGNKYMVSNLKDGEWLEYTICVREKQNYGFDLRLRSKNASLSISVNTQNVSGIVKTIQTNEWQTVTIPNIYLNEGDLVVKLQVTRGAIDFNWIEVVREKNS